MPDSPLAEAVRAWREARCAEACPICPVNCCEGRLNPQLDSLERFGDLPRVRGRQPRPAPPYVLEERGLFGGACWLVGRCPHLAAGRCDIFGEAGRPSDCVEYPARVQRSLGTEMVSAERSCWILQDAGRQDELAALARAHGAECVFHEPQP